MKVNLREIPARIYLRYLLLMVPGAIVLIVILIVIQQWVVMPAWLFGAIIFLWVAKEVVIFPFVWRSHDTRRPGISRKMIGERGIVKERLDPVGYIQVGGELWRAESVEAGLPIAIGEVVWVAKMEGLKLFVRRERSENERHQ